MLKNDVRVCSISNLVNLVKALLGSMFDLSISFDGHVRVTFEFVRYSKNDVQVRSMFDKMVFNTSLRSKWTFAFVLILQ